MGGSTTPFDGGGGGVAGRSQRGSADYIEGEGEDHVTGGRGCWVIPGGGGRLLSPITLNTFRREICVKFETSSIHKGHTHTLTHTHTHTHTHTPPSHTQTHTLPPALPPTHPHTLPHTRTLFCCPLDLSVWRGRLVFWTGQQHSSDPQSPSQQKQIREEHPSIAAIVDAKEM